MGRMERINLSLYWRILCLIVLSSFGGKLVLFFKFPPKMLGLMLVVVMLKKKVFARNDGPLTSNLNEEDECLYFLLEIADLDSKMFF